MAVPCGPKKSVLQIVFENRVVVEKVKNFISVFNKFIRVVLVFRKP